MRQVRIVRAHRSGSWTVGWIGEVVWVEEDEPHVEMAAVYGTPWVEEPVLGWDVCMHLLTLAQLAKYASLTDNLAIGVLFVPEECCEPV